MKLFPDQKKTNIRELVKLSTKGGPKKITNLYLESNRKMYFETHTKYKFPNKHYSEQCCQRVTQYGITKHFFEQ